MSELDELRMLLSPRSESSLGDWSDDDVLKTMKLRGDVVQAQADQVALLRDAAAERKRLNDAQRANNDAAEAALQAEMGGTLRTSAPRIREVRSNDNAASRRLEEIEARWQEAKENERDGLGKLRRHYIEANKRAAKAETYRKYEELMLAAIMERRKLDGMNADLEGLSGERLTHDTWGQTAIPAEPGLASSPRQYHEVDQASWLYRAESEPPGLAQKFLTRSRLDFERLLGSDIKIDWTPKRPAVSMPPIRIDRVDTGRGGW